VGKLVEGGTATDVARSHRRAGAKAGGGDLGVERRAEAAECISSYSYIHSKQFHILNIGGGNESVGNHTGAARAVRVRAVERASRRVFVGNCREYIADGRSGGGTEVSAEKSRRAIGRDIVGSNSCKRLGLRVPRVRE
jgi:hypothetical protein